MPNDRVTTRVLLRREAVEAKTGLSKRQLYRLLQAGDFPKPIPITKQGVGWIEAEIDAWIEARIKAARDSK